MRFLLFPFSLIYRIITSFRNFLYDGGFKKSTEFDISIISVGNLSVGGTGKTPHTEFLVSILKNKFNIATLSRGYKRKTKGFLLAEKNSSFEDIGDEPKQISNKFPEIKVAVCENRVKGVKKIIENDKETEIVILDDAFQHRKIKPSISILLMDYNSPFYDDNLLPYGKLRESWHEYRRSQIIIVTKSPEDLKPIDRRIISKKINVLPFQTIYFTTIKYREILPVFDVNSKVINIENCKSLNYSILLVTGIANSSILESYLNENVSSKITHLSFGDHYNFNKKSIQKIISAFDSINNTQKIILTTEKDAIRLIENKFFPDNLKEFLYFVKIEIDFLFNSKEEFEKQIIENVKKNRTNYQLQLSKSQF